MKIYSNILISWPQRLHIFQQSRLYPGSWFNRYHIYRVQNIQPLTIRSYSPINLLQENRKYYCYNNFHRDEYTECFGNIYTPILMNAASNNNITIYTYIPKYIEDNDILYIYHVIPNIIKPYLSHYSPSLLF